MASTALRTCKFVSTLLKNSSKCSCLSFKIRNFSAYNTNVLRPPIISNASLTNYSMYLYNLSWLQCCAECFILIFISERNFSKYTGVLNSAQDPNAEEKERQRREQERMNEEDTKKRESDWKRVKLTFWAFGGTISVLGTWMIYELGT